MYCICWRKVGRPFSAPYCSFSKKKESVSSQSLFITTDTPLDYKIMESASTTFDHHCALSLENIPKSWKSWISYGFQLLKVAKKIYTILKKYRPTAVYTTGGYIALPVAFIAKIMGIPVYAYHLDVIPGKAGVLIHSIATCSYICMPQTEKYLPQSRALIKKVEYPLRFDESDRIDRKTACDHLKINEERYVVLVVGGSQGSVSINSIMQEALSLLDDESKKKIHILHQASLQETESLREWYVSKEISASIFDYNFDLAHYYCAAHYIISRAGAGSLAEIKFFNKSAALIPLRGCAGDHQKYNAEAYVEDCPQLMTSLVDLDREACSKYLINVIHAGCNA